MSNATDHLADWLRDVNLEPGATRVPVMQNAAAALATETRGRSVLDLVLLAHGKASTTAVDSVAAALRAGDDNWAVRQGDLAGELTAGLAVALAMEGQPETAVPFALAVRSARFAELQPKIAELPDLAQASLVRASEALRRRVQLTVVAPDIKGAIAAAPTVGEGEIVHGEHLAAAMAAAGTAATRAGDVTSRALRTVMKRFEALEEELDVLWWAFGHYSDSADKPFKDVAEQAAPTIAGIELAARTAKPCPLPSTRAILSRVIQARIDKETDLGRAIPAVLKLIGNEVLPESGPGHQLLPVLSSASEYRSMGGKPVWKESVVARYDVDPVKATTHLDLAEQVTRELLLIRSSVE